METINDRRLQQERKTADLEAQRARQRKQMELQKDYREQMARLQSDREKQNQEEALVEKTAAMGPGEGRVEENQ